MMTSIEIVDYKSNMEVVFFWFYIVFTFSTVSTSDTSLRLQSGVDKAFFIKCLASPSQWVDLVEAGWNRLAPSTDAESMQGTIRNALGGQGKLLAPSW